MSHGGADLQGRILTVPAPTSPTLTLAILDAKVLGPQLFVGCIAFLVSDQGPAGNDYNWAVASGDSGSSCEHEMRMLSVTWSPFDLVRSLCIDEEIANLRR